MSWPMAVRVGKLESSPLRPLFSGKAGGGARAGSRKCRWVVRDVRYRGCLWLWEVRTYSHLDQYALRDKLWRQEQAAQGDALQPPKLLANSQPLKDPNFHCLTRRNPSHVQIIDIHPGRCLCPDR
jgi:hypothetical protein